MRFCSLNVQNMVLKFDLANRRWVVYSRAYGNQVHALTDLRYSKPLKTFKLRLKNATTKSWLSSMIL